MSFSGRQVVHYNVMSAKAANGVGSSIPVRDFRNCVVRVGTASSANLKIKAQGAITNLTNEYVSPDFSAARSVTNNWEYIQIVDLNDGSAITGDTGVTFSGTDDYRLFEININGLDFISFEVSNYSAGSVTIDVQLTSNL